MAEERAVCKAIVQQGSRKNLNCERLPLDNGYCIYHQRNYKYESLISSGKNLCGMFFRGCNEELSEEDLLNNYKNCTNCRLKKSGKQYTCKKEGCSFHIKNEDDKYCRKHIRHLLHDNESIEKIIYCDIDRGCFNKVISGNKCDSCKEKERCDVASTIKILRDTHKIKETLPSKTNLHIKQETNTITVAELWRSVQRNAYARGLLFTINESEFEKCIIQPCYYCGFYSKTRLNGIDRIDNNKGYISKNCLPCCTVCNIIKNRQHPLEFLDKVDIIYKYYNDKISISHPAIEKWKSYSCSSLRETYSEYIAQSKKRNIELLLSNTEYNNLIEGTCYLCGISNSKQHTNGIDRFDSSKRYYSIENSRTCCGHCNLMKGTLLYSDFIDKCTEIYKYKCIRSIFEHVPMYSNIKCRNEFYTADDIYDMMTNGKYVNYIEWCKEKDKTPEFISAINLICHSDSEKSIRVEQIRLELERERTRITHINNLTNKKFLQSSTLYSYLTQGKIELFKDWYYANYNKTNLFDEQLTNLFEILPTLSYDKGIEACKKFIYDEKNRRISQERREREKKLTKYSNTSITIPNLDKKSTESENKNEIIYPDVIDNIEPIINKVKSIQEKKGYIKVNIPKQWKTKQIYEAIRDGKADMYKTYCEEHNTLDETWDVLWNTFVLSVKETLFEQSEPIIRAFVENLRRIRHNELCANRTKKVD
jgi:hypothetical protein